MSYLSIFDSEPLEVLWYPFIYTIPWVYSALYALHQISVFLYFFLYTPSKVFMVLQDSNGACLSVSIVIQCNYVTSECMKKGVGRCQAHPMARYAQVSSWWCAIVITVNTIYLLSIKPQYRFGISSSFWEFILDAKYLIFQTGDLNR